MPSIDYNKKVTSEEPVRKFNSLLFISIIQHSIFYTLGATRTLSYASGVWWQQKREYTTKKIGYLLICCGVLWKSGKTKLSVFVAQWENFLEIK